MLHVDLPVVRRAQPRRVGGEDLEGESAAGGEVLADRVQCLLTVMRLGQHQERVEGQADKAVEAVKSQPTDVLVYVVDPAAHVVGLTSEPPREQLDHLQGAVDCGDIEAGARQRQGDAPRAGAELEDRAARSGPFLGQPLVESDVLGAPVVYGVVPARRRATEVGGVVGWEPVLSQATEKRRVTRLRVSTRHIPPILSLPLSSALTTLRPASSK